MWWGEARSGKGSGAQQAGRSMPDETGADSSSRTQSETAGRAAGDTEGRTEGRTVGLAPQRELAPAARRALAEAEARRAEIDARAAMASAEREVDGRGGLEPVRYTDWEVKGIASDF
jgi:hypothetical protein